MTGIKLILALFLATSLGLAIGYFARSSRAPLPVVNRKDIKDNWISKDLEDYKRLRSLEAKYLKADEILGKMILLFLADIGLRAENVSFSLKDWRENRTLEKHPQTSPQNTFGNSSPQKNNDNPVNDESKSQSQAQRFEFERKIQNDEFDENDREIRENLILKNPAKALFDSREIKNEFSKLDLLLGSYRGWINLNDGKKLWVELEVSQEPTKSHTPAGKFELKIYKDGEDKPYSHNSSTGSFRSILIPKSKTDAIFIKATDSFFLQLYANKRQGALVGNAYKRDKEFVHYGKVYLTR